MLEYQVRELVEKYRTQLQKQLESRNEEMQQDDNVHFLIYRVLGISEIEGRLVDI